MLRHIQSECEGELVHTVCAIGKRVSKRVSWGARDVDDDGDYKCKSWLLLQQSVVLAGQMEYDQRRVRWYVLPSPAAAIQSTWLDGIVVNVSPTRELCGGFECEAHLACWLFFVYGEATEAAQCSAVYSGHT